MRALRNGGLTITHSSIVGRFSGFVPLEERRLGLRLRRFDLGRGRLVMAGNAVGALAAQDAPGRLASALVTPDRGHDRVEGVVLSHGASSG